MRIKAVLTQVPVGATYMEVVDPSADVHDIAVANIEAARVRRLIRELPEIERRVVRWRYGIEAEVLTVREIAGRLGIGKSTVSDIEKRALVRLRASVAVKDDLAAA